MAQVVFVILKVQKNMKKYDVAISFSTADILFAKEIFKRLQSKKVKVYYYIHKPEETLGTNLKEKLSEIYSNATLVVVVHSENYLTDYTEIELQAALSGHSKKEGIIPVKLDKKALPISLEGRTYWELKQGSDELVEVILKKLKKPEVKKIQLLLMVSSIVTLALGYITLQLGFNDFTRPTDALFIFLAGLPIIWFLVFKMLPDRIKSYRLKKLKGDNLLQSPIERNLEQTSSLIKIATIFLTILVTIYSTYYRNEIVDKYNEYLNFDASLNIQFEKQSKIFKDLSSKITKAATKVLPTDIEHSKKIKTEVTILGDSIKTINSELNLLLSNQSLSIVDSISNNYIAKLTQCDRILDKYINYQISELAKDKQYLGYDSWLENRLTISKTLMNYNSFFTTAILELDEAFQAIKKESALNAEKIRSRWKGVI